MISGGGKIRVVYVINDLLVGGAQRIMCDLILNLDTTAFQVDVVYLRDDESDSRATFFSDLRNAGTSLHLIDARRLGKITTLYRLCKTLWKIRAHVVHCLLPDAIVFGVCAARVNGIRAVVVHEMNAPGFYSRKLRIALALARRMARLTVCYSEQLEREIAGNSHVITRSFSRTVPTSCTIYNGVNISRIYAIDAQKAREQTRSSLGISADDVVILCAARLVEWKGQVTLLKAFARVWSQFPKTRLVLAGDGPLRSRIEKEIVLLGLEGAVFVLGARNDIYALMHASDIFSLAIEYPPGFDSINLGMSSIEAMACGLPSIASSYNDTYAGIANGENILLINPGDVDDLTQAILSLVSSPEERSRIGVRAKIYAEKHFDAATIAKVYEKIYRILGTTSAKKDSIESAMR